VSLGWGVHDDLRGNFPQLFEKDDVPINGGMRWSRNPLSTMKKTLRMKDNILLLIKCCSFVICLEILRTKFL
jgi:hypothetical protein